MNNTTISSSLLELGARLAGAGFFTGVDFFFGSSSELADRVGAFFEWTAFFVLETGISLSLDEFAGFGILIPFTGSFTPW